MKAAIVDLMHGKGTSSITAHVALTRVCRRDDLIVYRPCVRSAFTGGPIEGPKLLMKQLRGERVGVRGGVRIGDAAEGALRTEV